MGLEDPRGRAEDRQERPKDLPEGLHGIPKPPRRPPKVRSCRAGRRGPAKTCIKTTVFSTFSKPPQTLEKPSVEARGTSPMAPEGPRGRPEDRQERPKDPQKSF